MIEESLDYVECPYDAEVNVLLTDNAGIHQINLDMRGIDNPTDVLSFPMCDFETPGDFSHLEDTPEEYFDPDTGASQTVTMDEMNAMVAGSGNTFIGYIK